MNPRRYCLSARSLAILTVLSVSSVAWSHEGHDHGDEHKTAAPKFPRAIVLPALEGPKPWSDKPLLDDPDRFQIAIMTDNTGGHRPGIWMKAVERLNLLRPTFVMSVGDLIEGYSTDPVEIEAEWKEFLGFIDKMQMKFFFVAGNHDVSNPVMHEMWRKHFGPEWYSFDYKGVHFVCLSSEDTHDQIGPKQLAWLEADLKKNAEARWTMLFFHKPLWTIAERALAAGNPDTTNWKQVEKLLGERPHTVFAGHVHHYVQYDRRGMKYYHLATTGGGSQLRGIPYGEFDHVAWLTMEKEGPTVVNLLLDGIVPADTVTETGIARFRDFLAKTRVEIAPILIDEDEGFSEGRIDLRLINTFDVPVEMTAKIEGLPLRGLTVEPNGLKLIAAPGATQELSVKIRFGEKIAFPHLAETLLTAKIRSLDDERPLSVERTVPVVIDRKYGCPRAPEKVAIDGNLEEWGDLSLATGDKPLLIGAAQQWQGVGDAAMRFTTAYDDAYLYVAAKVADDNVIAGDQLQFRFDARWIATRKAENLLRAGTYTLSIPAPLDAPLSPAAKGTAILSGSPKLVSGAGDSVLFAKQRTPSGWNVEAAIPLEMLVKNQSENWHSFQMTPILTDVDDPTDQRLQMVWRGTAEAAVRNTNFGQFVRAKPKSVGTK